MICCLIRCEGAKQVPSPEHRERLNLKVRLAVRRTVSGDGFVWGSIVRSRLGCSPFSEQSLIGIIVPPMMIPIKDCCFRGNIPRLRGYLNSAAGLGTLRGKLGENPPAPPSASGTKPGSLHWAYRALQLHGLPGTWMKVSGLRLFQPQRSGLSCAQAPLGMKVAD